MKKISAIFFDLGNVIVNFDIGILEKEYSKHGKIPKSGLMDFIMVSGAGNDYMRGRINSSKFYSKTRKQFKMGLSFPEFYRIWNSMFFPSPEMENIVKTIKQKYPEITLVLVSDTNEAHFEFIEKEYEVLKHIDHFVLSHEVGRIKPHPDMYNTATRLSGSLAKETLYVDDRADLIKAARTMGIRAHQFVGHEALRKKLTEFGIEV